MDREKVIKEYESFVDKYECFCSSDDYVFEMHKAVLALLKEQEAVKPKTGHWIYLQYCANEGVYCSECHTKMFDYYPMKKKLSQFCGHCGAKMDDEVEGR